MPVSPTLHTPALPSIQVDSNGNVLPVATSANQLAANSSLSTIAAALASLLSVDTVVKAISVNRGAIVGTTSVTLMPANTSRRGFSVQNQSTSATIYVSGVATATADYNSLMIGPGGYFETPAHHAGTGAISVISSAATTSVYAREW